MTGGNSQAVAAIQRRLHQPKEPNTPVVAAKIVKITGTGTKETFPVPRS